MGRHAHRALRATGRLLQFGQSLFKPKPAFVALVLGLTIAAVAPGATAGPTAHAQSGPSQKDARLAKISHNLIAVYDQRVLQQEAELGLPLTPAVPQAITPERPVEVTPPSPFVRIIGGLLAIDAVASGDPDQLLTDLVSLGLTNASTYGRIVSGRLPVDAFPALPDLVNLNFARPSLATTNVGW